VDFTCEDAPAPALWSHDAKAAGVQVGALTFNLDWSSVFDGDVWPGYMHHYEQAGGNGAINLITGAVQATPYDVLAFQECPDGAWVLKEAGLSELYTMYQGMEELCLAFRTEVWSLLDKGQEHVTEDLQELFWRQRAVQWLRLRHIRGGATMLFMNHHGPLPTNTGGLCGEANTANRILSVIATHGQAGDIIVLVGDFNANAAAVTLKTLESQLHRVFSGSADGGVDSIFSNMAAVPATTQNLGGGGSDHDALSAIFTL